MIAPSGYSEAPLRGAILFISDDYKDGRTALLDDCLRIVSHTLGLLSENAHGSWEMIRRNPIWLEYEDQNFQDRPVYHESPEWVVDNGYHPAKGRCVQLTKTLSLWHTYQPMILLHELAHQYHHQVLSYEDPSIINAYEQAKASGKYENVTRNSGEVGTAYAMTNHKEYFSELSEAYFERNDYPPFTRRELEVFDPGGYEAISRAWSRP